MIFEPLPANHVKSCKNVAQYGPKHLLFEDVAAGQWYDAGANGWTIFGDRIFTEVVGMSDKVRLARNVGLETVTEPPAVVVFVEGRKKRVILLDLGLVASGLRVIYKCSGGTEGTAARAPARFVIGLREATTAVRS